MSQSQVVPNPDRLLPIGQVVNLTGFCRSFIYGKVAGGSFPPPVKIGRSSRWRQSQIAKWISEQGAPAAKGGGA